MLFQEVFLTRSPSMFIICELFDIQSDLSPAARQPRRDIKFSTEISQDVAFSAKRMGTSAN